MGKGIRGGAAERGVSVSIGAAGRMGSEGVKVSGEAVGAVRECGM